MTPNVQTKTTDIACAECGAKVGERCSDAEVFVRDEAFHRQGAVPLATTLAKVESAS